MMRCLAYVREKVLADKIVTEYGSARGRKVLRGE